eukprot:TRINITY_DN9288_c0_g1_i3.p1 TRINITY_DN9288_c0_g1~~TRINITY_DN9288_c0_g1_i3.p1  ORF type:complete len:129 (+),score=34.30 TRINITY_DN9288_c0_g1_i3:104-490(+)
MSEEGEEVILNVYDVGTSKAVSRLNKVVKTVGLGAFHGAIEVYGKEYSFGQVDGPGSGVFMEEPRQCEMHQYKESISLGKTKLDRRAVTAILQELSEEWQGNTYVAPQPLSLSLSLSLSFFLLLLCAP